MDKNWKHDTTNFDYRIKEFAAKNDPTNQLLMRTRKEIWATKWFQLNLHNHAYEWMNEYKLYAKMEAYMLSSMNEIKTRKLLDLCIEQWILHLYP